MASSSVSRPRLSAILARGNCHERVSDWIQGVPESSMEMKSTTPRPLVFVLMPFSPDFDDVYKLGIKPACERAGALAERVDEQIFSESILDRIYTQISKADVIVADMTGRNPNVFYETGYAHALGKNVVLLTQTAEDIPFDLKHYPHIIYQGRIADLSEELENRVRWAIENPRGVEEHSELDLEFFHDSVAIKSGSVIEYYADYEIGAWNKFRLDVHNPARRRLRSASFQLGIVTSRIIGDLRIRRRSVTRVKLENKEYLHLPQATFKILPGAWQSISLEFRARGRFEPGMDLPIVLRVFSEAGFRDHAFVIRMAELTIDSDSSLDLT